MIPEQSSQTEQVPSVVIGAGHSFPKPRRRFGFPRWVQGTPFIVLHLALISVFFVPVSVTAVVLCAATYLIRMFGITGGYHRYFAHRAYKTSRVFQFFLAWLGCSALQKGPLWWAGASSRASSLLRHAERSALALRNQLLVVARRLDSLRRAYADAAGNRSRTGTAIPNCAGWTATTGFLVSSWPCCVG